MYKGLKVATIVPAYNEGKLIAKTLESQPDYIDSIYVINDGSTDNTIDEIKSVSKKDKRIFLIDLKINQGLGFGLRTGLQKASKDGNDLMAIFAGDGQMDPKYLPEMIDEMLDKKLDFIKANRFMHFEQLKSMPLYRKIGNIIVTILTKFATGYYAIFDTQNGYAVYTKKVVDKIPWRLVGSRYEYENSVLIALSIIGARISDYPIPALYGDEKSTIKLFSTTMRVLKVLFFGFWKRIYYKYVLYNFHPVALFLFGGIIVFLLGIIDGIYVILQRMINNIVPNSGALLPVVLLLVLGFQLLLTGFILDVNEEKRI